MLPFCNKPCYNFVIKSCYNFAISHVSHKVFCSINHSGILSTCTVHQGFYFYCRCYCAVLPCISLLRLYCLHEELTVWFLSSEAAAHDQMSFGPLPSIQNSTIETTLMGVPIHARNCSCLADLGCFKYSVLTLYSSQKHCTGLP